MRVLICTSYRVTIHPALLEAWHTNARALAAERGDHLLRVLCLPDRADGDAGPGKFAPHARARNAVLAAIDLRDYDYLYWMDADILCWPGGLLEWALTHNPAGVTAPAVLLDRYIDRFYDTWGFLEAGRPAALYPPWFAQAGPIIDLDSVGCCYVIPSAAYQAGAVYRDTPGATEHLSVCQAAKAQGRRVLANLEYQAVHAWLPEYGEAVH